MTCPFCVLPRDRIVEENEHAFWIYDGFPVATGHSLIIPKRHVGSFFDISGEERSAILDCHSQLQYDLPSGARFVLPNKISNHLTEGADSTSPLAFENSIAVQRLFADIVTGATRKW